MAQEITGVVQEVKTKTTKLGKPAYDIVVGGESYGVGFYAPKCKIGDYVKFTLDDERGFKNVGRNTLKVSANKAPAEAVAEAAATAPKISSTGGSFDTRQDAISRQAASNTAIAYMALLQAVGALPATAAKGKGQQVMDTIRREYEKTFYEQNTGIAFKDIGPAVKAAKEEAVSEETATPADEDWG